MTDLRKAAEEAAKVLANALSIDFNDKRDWYSYKHDVEYAANLLCQALAQPEQEPVAWATFDGEGNYDFMSYESNETYRDEYIKRNGKKYANWVKPLYTAPPSKPWVSLTDEEIVACGWCDLRFARAIEAKLKERNT